MDGGSLEEHCVIPGWPLQYLHCYSLSRGSRYLFLFNLLSQEFGDEQITQIGSCFMSVYAPFNDGRTP